MQIFTDENFSGYEFRCTSASANTGFKHVCEVYKNNEPIDSCMSVVNWGNRTWESFQYATVLQDSKDKLTNLLDGIEKPEIDYDFLNTLANEGYIHDYGDMESGETVILMDGWYQVDGDSHYEDEHDEEGNYTGFHKVIDRPSVYHKLYELAEKGLLKPSINSTILNTDYVFTDEYEKCWECGTVHNTQYGDLTYVEEEGLLLCDKCLSSPDRVESLINDAKDDFRKALKPTIDQSIIEDLGYTLVTDETFSFDKEFWGATYMTEEDADKFIHKYNGFIQIYQVAQFVVPFQIWVPNDRLEDAQREINFKYNL